jgi:hypothetical protein
MTLSWPDIASDTCSSSGGSFVYAQHEHHHPQSLCEPRCATSNVIHQHPMSACCVCCAAPAQPSVDSIHTQCPKLCSPCVPGSCAPPRPSAVQLGTTCTADTTNCRLTVAHRLCQDLVHLLVEALVVAQVDERVSKTDEHGRDDVVVLGGASTLQKQCSCMTGCSY